MAIGFSIDPNLIELPLGPSDHRSKAAVTGAIGELVAGGQQRRLLDLIGKLDWRPDYEAERRRD